MTTVGAAPSAEELPQAHDVADSRAELRRRMRVLARRYYPLGIGAAFLAMVVGFFPSASPIPTGLIFSASPPAKAHAYSSAPSAQGATSTAGSSDAGGAYGSDLNSGSGYDTGGGYAEGSLGTSSADYANDSGTGSGGSTTSPPGPPPGVSGSIPPGASCPVPVPNPGAPANSFVDEVTSLCETLLAGQGSLAPSPTSLVGATGAGGTDSVPPLPSTTANTGKTGDWVVVGRLTTTTALGAAGTPVVLVGLVSTQAVPAAVAAELAAVGRGGALADVVLVPGPGAAGGPSGFAGFVSRTLSALGTVPLAAVEASALPQGASWSSVAGEVAAGLGAAESGHGAGERVGLLWGGTQCASESAVSELAAGAGSRSVATAVWQKVGYLTAASPVVASCGGTAGLARLAGGLGLANGTPQVVLGPLGTAGSG
ncbi:MAG TPA: hypothetical protein VMR97_04255 [Acidimicrobiales bacterium]|nr:hypothetical protein [Acidimicrobiales bacterium]